ILAGKRTGNVGNGPHDDACSDGEVPQQARCSEKSTRRAARTDYQLMEPIPPLPVALFVKAGHRPGLELSQDAFGYFPRLCLDVQTELLLNQVERSSSNPADDIADGLRDFHDDPTRGHQPHGSVLKLLPVCWVKPS